MASGEVPKPLFNAHHRALTIDQRSGAILTQAVDLEGSDLTVIILGSSMEFNQRYGHMYSIEVSPIVYVGLEPKECYKRFN